MTWQCCCLHNPLQLLPQPVELVSARVENLWRERKCWKARRARAISGAVLAASSGRWFSAAVQFHPCSALGVRVDGNRTWKKGSREKTLSSKASLGAGSGSGCLPHQQLSVQGGFWIGTVGNRGFYRQCHNCICYHKSILKKPCSCTDFNKSINPRENGIKMQVFKVGKSWVGQLLMTKYSQSVYISNPLHNMHNVQRLWHSILKIRAVGSHKHWILVEFRTKFPASLIPMVNSNLSSNVNEKRHYRRQQSLQGDTKGGIKSKSCWEVLGGPQKEWGRKNGDCPRRMMGILPK